MNLKTDLIKLSEDFIHKIKLLDGVEEIKVKNYGWENFVYRTPKIRQLHVERYFTENLWVLHITAFPQKNNQSPIFGFDVVCGGKDKKILSVFLDLTPSIKSFPFSGPVWKVEREVPDWADMFSENFVAIRPEVDEYNDVYNFGLELFDYFLDEVNHQENEVVDEKVITDIINSQDYYCQQQWKNKRTMGALSSKIGKELAEEFMQTILFPKVETTDGR